MDTAAQARTTSPIDEPRYGPRRMTATYRGCLDMAYEAVTFHCSRPEDPLFRSEAIVRYLFGEICNNTGWVMQHPGEYTDPVATLVTHISRYLLPVDAPRCLTTLEATAIAMIDGMAWPQPPLPTPDADSYVHDVLFATFA